MNARCSVFANGVWKSGNNLLAKLVDMLGFGPPRFGLAASTVVGRQGMIRKLLRAPLAGEIGIPIGLDLSVSARPAWLRRAIRRKSGICIGGHAAFSDHLLWMLKEYDVRPIQIVRDPRDVVCSYAHWIASRPDFYAHEVFCDLSLEDRMLRLLRGGAQGGLYFESFPSILDRAYGWITRPEEVLVVRFEDLVGPAGGGSEEAQHAAIAGICSWLDADVHDVEKLGSELFGGTSTFRSGRVEGWRADFTARVASEFESSVGDRLIAWGYAS